MPWSASASPDAVLPHGLAMRGRTVHDRTGELAYQSYSADGSKAINSISRHGLNCILVDAAAAAGVDDLLRRPRRRRRCRRRPADARVAGTVDHDVVLGADGAYSVAARHHRPRGAQRLLAGAPAVGVQGAHHRRAGGRLRLRPPLAAHLAARRLDDDRACPTPTARSPPPCSGRSTARPASPASTPTRPSSPASSATTPTPCRCSRTWPASSRRNPVGSLVTVASGRGPAAGWRCSGTRPTPSCRSTGRG